MNVDLTRAVADAAGEARVPRLVLVSSVPVHAGGTPYAGSKREGKCVAADAARRHGTQLVIVRPATIIGEGDPGNSGMKSTRSERFERIACAES